MKGGNSHGIVAYILDYDIVVNEFKLQLCYNVHYLFNTLRKGVSSIILPTNRLNSTITVFLNQLIGLVGRVFVNGPGDQE